MSVIADISIPADEFGLGHLLEVRPGVQVRLESMIPTGEAVIPYFWVRSPDIEAVERALTTSPLVEGVHVVDEVEDETLFRVDWAADIDGVIEAFADHEAVVLDGEGHGDFWSFDLRFADHEQLSAFYRDLVDKGISVELETIHNPDNVDRYDLSTAQREALTIALEQGYFAVPREATLVDLAEQLDISDSALSQRLRRGLSKILAANLGEESA